MYRCKDRRVLTTLPLHLSEIRCYVRETEPITCVLACMYSSGSSHWEMLVRPASRRCTYSFSLRSDECRCADAAQFIASSVVRKPVTYVWTYRHIRRTYLLSTITRKMSVFPSRDQSILPYRINLSGHKLLTIHWTDFMAL